MGKMWSKSGFCVTWEGEENILTDDIVVKKFAENLKKAGISLEIRQDTSKLTTTPNCLIISKRAFSIAVKKNDIDKTLNNIVQLAEQRYLFLKTPRIRTPPLREVRIIGISGPSCSGKSTLAKAIRNQVSSPLSPVKADMFFDTSLIRKCKAPWNDRLDFERSDGINWLVLKSEIERITHLLRYSSHLEGNLFLASTAFFALAPNILHANVSLGNEPVTLIVEGFLLFTNEEISNMFNKRLFLEVDFETCLKRRWKRDGCKSKKWVISKNDENPPEEYKHWFREVVWSAYEEQVPDQLKHQPIVLQIDDNVDIEKLLKQVTLI